MVDFSARFDRRRVELHRITHGPLCFALEVTDGVVTSAAPVARWAVGKQWAFVRGWYRSKGAEVQEVRSG